jgi:hypothetical protein
MIDRKLARMEVHYINNNLEKDPIMRRNSIFNNVHKGQRCFVVANGPSLEKQDLTFLKDEITIGTNSIWKHADIDIWKPKYYCTAHLETFDEEKKNLREGFEQFSIDEGREYYKNASKYMPSTKYFIPRQGYVANEKYKLLDTERTYYTASYSYPLFELLPEFPDLTHGLPGMQDSSQYAIMIAMAMGCSPIILLGCDHDWFVKLGEEKHFFHGSTMSNDGNKFDSTKFPVLEMSWFNWVLWRGHDALKKMADSHNIEIWNATGGGVLDIYPLRNYDDLVKKQVKSLSPI